MNNIRCLIALFHIHRGNPVGIARSFRSWRAGVATVYDLRGLICR